MKTLMLSQSCNLTPNLQIKNMKYKIDPLQWLTGTKEGRIPKSDLPHMCKRHDHNSS
jgi:hypothetical protein